MESWIRLELLNVIHAPIPQCRLLCHSDLSNFKRGKHSCVGIPCLYTMNNTTFKVGFFSFRLYWTQNLGQGVVGHSRSLGADLLPVLVTLCARDFPETPTVVRPETRTSGSLETQPLLL